MGYTPETTVRNSKGEIRVDGMTFEEFKVRAHDQDGLRRWFWLGHLKVEQWLKNPAPERVNAICQLPKVQEFLRRFAALAGDADWEKQMIAEDVYHFFWLCEDAEDQINACYNALCYDD